MSLALDHFFTPAQRRFYAADSEPPPPEGTTPCRCGNEHLSFEHSERGYSVACKCGRDGRRARDEFDAVEKWNEDRLEDGKDGAL